MAQFISSIPLPRRYNLTSVGFDSFGVENCPDGQNMDAREVLEYREKLIKEVLLSAASTCDAMASALNNELMLQCDQYKDILRAKAEICKKLSRIIKEGV